MTLLPCISKSPSFISLRYATTLESSTSDTSGGVSWVSRDTFHKGIDDNDLLQHAIHVDLINARSTPSRFTTLEEYQASHIIPYAHENAVSQHLIWSPNINLHLFSRLRSSFTAAHIMMKMSQILH